jgi:alpha/beta superfamily hydrolase
MPVQSPERVTVQGPAGRLDALVEYPADPPVGVGVICHPHPLHGGTRDNKVVYTLAKVMNSLGRISVRFNFRGVGESDGWHDHGEGESEDVLAMVDWARAALGLPLWLGGFSFGACMAARVAGSAECERLVLVAPAIERYGVDALPVSVPFTLVQGLEDEVIDAGATLDWARRQPGDKHILEFDGVGHFFHGAQVRLRRELVSTLTGDPTQEQPA